MSINDEATNLDLRKRRGNTKRVGSLFLGMVALLAAWVAVANFHVLFLQGYIADLVAHNYPILRVTLIAALGGFVLSVPVLRHFSGKDKSSEVKVQPIPQYRSPRVHPLFMTSRPARDTSFVIRKTRNRGRISRNRAGERLPPSNQE